MITVEPVTLEGRWIRLQPLQREHVAALAHAADHPDIWRYLPVRLDTVENVREWVEASLANAAIGTELPFVQVERETGTVVGSTRVMDIRPEHDGAEIGSTWLARRWWRTCLNSEAKYVLLRHLFGTVGCIRVSLKTDLQNERSQRAIERLGATREGVLRSHMIVLDGRVRDTVYYSILEREWPEIKERMEGALYC